MFDHFLAAQDPIYPTVFAELRAGNKQSHWMWFVFPQLRALGRSETARHFGLADLAEARAYLAHPILGPRLVECTQAVLAVTGRTAHQIFHSPDDLKFRSCLTLFIAASTDPAGSSPAQRGEGDHPRTRSGGSGGGGPTREAAHATFTEALSRYYAGDPDPLTLDLLAGEARSST